MRAVLLLLTLLLVASRARADNDFDCFSPEAIREFADHLAASGDDRRAAGEYLRLLLVAGDSPETNEVRFLLGRSYRRAGEYERALDAFGAAGGTWLEQARFETAITFLFAGQPDQALPVLESIGEGSFSPVYDVKLLLGMSCLLESRWDAARVQLAGSPSPFAPELFALARIGSESPRKNEVDAGVISFLLPGAGKLYAERPADAFFSFVLVATLGTLSGLNFSAEGPCSTRGWIYGSLALLFHLGNVYGGVAAARNYNRDLDARLQSQAREFLDARLR
jgi:hypothetical protein